MWEFNRSKVRKKEDLMTFADDFKTVDDGDVTFVLHGGSLRPWAYEEGIFV